MFPSLNQPAAFSIITIAASTIAPIAMAIPPKDMMLAFTPCTRMTSKAASTPRGKVTIATSADRTCQQKQPADDRDDDELLDQLARQILHRAVDQLRAVIGGDDLDAGEGSLSVPRAWP